MITKFLYNVSYYYRNFQIRLANFEYLRKYYYYVLKQGLNLDVEIPRAGQSVRSLLHQRPAVLNSRRAFSRATARTLARLFRQCNGTGDCNLGGEAAKARNPKGKERTAKRACGSLAARN